MKKYTENSYAIAPKYRPLKFGLFVEQDKQQYIAFNKWTGDEIGTFDSVEEAQTAIRNICK